MKCLPVMLIAVLAVVLFVPAAHTRPERAPQISSVQLKKLRNTEDKAVLLFKARGATSATVSHANQVENAFVVRGRWGVIIDSQRCVRVTITASNEKRTSVKRARACLRGSITLSSGSWSGE